MGRECGSARDDICVFFFSSRRRHTRLQGDWSSDVCSSDLAFVNGSRANKAIWYSVPASAQKVRAASCVNPSELSSSVSSLRFVPVNAFKARLPLEIGRASCRERVLMRDGSGVWKCQGRHMRFFFFKQKTAYEITR